MEIISNIALISINETLIVQMVSFLIFMFVMNMVMFRPLNSVMKKRNEYMESLKQDVTDFDQEVIRLLDQMEKHEASARQEAMAIKKELEESGSSEAAGISTDIRNEISRLRADTEKEVESQIEKARENLRKETEHLAVSIMENVLNRRLAQ
ncbi:MAG: ATP synthase F0 subunit B [Deltaproteobacteria bacterium]|nr:ATP synthase F0 subunit B [Deltaproteobacteria bacterium]